MIVDLDRKDIILLLTGSQPNYNVIDKIPEEFGYYVGGFVNAWRWNNISDYKIEVKLSGNSIGSFTKDGRIFAICDGECMLFPSREQQDWRKFKIKKPKFDPKTLKPFDKVLVKYLKDDYWSCDLFSNITKDKKIYPYLCVSGVYKYCIPYNDDTKHLVATNKEAPEFYRYWED